MSTIGKVFLVLNLVLAGLFVGWAAKTLGHVDGAEAEASQSVGGSQQRQQGRADQAGRAVGTGPDGEERQGDGRIRAPQPGQRQHAPQGRARRPEARQSQLSGDVAKINETISGLNDRLQTIEQSKDTAMADARKMQGERDAALRKADDAEMAKRTAEETAKKSDCRSRSSRRTSRRAHGLGPHQGPAGPVVADTNYNITPASGVPDIAGRSSRSTCRASRAWWP
jgi:hypothetical protein